MSNSPLAPGGQFWRMLSGSRRLLQQPAPPSCILQLITVDSVAVEVRQAAAVNFKNFVKYHWVPREGDGLGAAPAAIPDAEKASRAGDCVRCS